MCSHAPRDANKVVPVPVPVPLSVPILFGSNSTVLFGSSVLFGSYIPVLKQLLDKVAHV